MKANSCRFAPPLTDTLSLTLNGRLNAFPPSLLVSAIALAGTMFPLPLLKRLSLTRRATSYLNK